MRQYFSICIFLCLSFGLVAQPPLSKKDQQKKAEFEALIEREQRYEETLQSADAAFEKKQYVVARMAYQEAIQYNAEQEQWLISKVNDLDILMARTAARSVDSIMVVVPKLDAAKLPTAASKQMEGRTMSTLPKSLPRQLSHREKRQKKLLRLSRKQSQILRTIPSVRETLSCSQKLNLVRRLSG